MTDANTLRFNAEALSWDSNPDVQQATRFAHKAYLAHLSPADDDLQSPALSTLDILDLGCGTGLLSLALAPSVRSVTAVDAADGMIDALQSKLSSGEHKNVRAVCALLESGDDERVGIDPVTGEKWTDANKGFDVVVSHLVLHHIPDLAALFKTVHECLRPGGRVVVTDFENFGPEARRFHPESKMDGVERHGIERREIRGLLEGAGFEEVSVETAFELEKKVETEPGSGVMEREMVFPFLICEGRK